MTARTRAVSWEDPRALAAAGRELSGIEYLRRLAAGELPAPPIALLLGFRLEEVGAGTATFVLEPGEHLYNPIGMVHGGVAATLMDSAMGCAVHTLLPAGKAYTTLEIKVNYVRPMGADTGPVRCTGTVIHPGTRTATAEARVLDGAGKLMAHGTTTCLIF